LRTRFAPSPTGYLHAGHAASAAYVWGASAAAGGQVLLRIEDIDQTRCRPEFEAAIYADLAWLGYQWPLPVRRQSDHFSDYADALGTLQTRGLVYRCFQTRKSRAINDDGRFVGAALPAFAEAEKLTAGEAFAWRLSISAARAQLGARYDRLSFTEITSEGPRRIDAVPDRFGDVVLARKDTPASYHIACCHDDALQAITHVIRGEDLRAATAVHVLIQALFDWPQPVYRFHPLLLSEDGRKLAKRDGDTPLRDYRAAGVTAEAIRRMTTPG
jgi:glutamyl-Q tRNA(Asp) synthetase